MGTLEENQRVVDEYLAKFKARDKAQPHTVEADPDDVPTTRMNPMGQVVQEEDPMRRPKPPAPPREPKYVEPADEPDVDYDLPEIPEELMDKPLSPQVQLKNAIINLNKTITELNQALPGLARNMLILARAIEAQTKSGGLF